MARRRFGRLFSFAGNLSLTAKGVLVVAVPVAALLVTMGAFYRLERQNKTAQGWVEHTFEVRSEIRQLMVDLGNAENGIRGYLLTGRESFLDPYNSAVAQIPQQIATIARLTSDNSSQQAAVASIGALVTRNMAAMEEMRRAVSGDNIQERISQLDASRAMWLQLRRELIGLQGREDQLLERRTETAAQSQTLLEKSILAGGVLGLIGGIFAALLFTTGVVRRVQDLEEDAHRVAIGVPLTEEVEGRDEIARLSATLRETSKLLTSQSEQLQAAQRDLEARVQQRTVQLSQVNEELHCANELKDALVRSTPLAIWTLDLDGNVSFWNTAAEQIFGWTAGEVVGHPLPILLPEQKEEYSEWLRRFQAGESLHGIERTRLKKDGSRIDVSIWTAPLTDPGGHVIGTVAIDNDITERKLLEEQFRQSQKLEAVGRLAGGVAHDFNNLLTVIMGYIEMLMSEAQGHPALVDYAQEIQYAANRASALTAQLLAFSRRQVSQPKVIDLNEVVSHSTKLLRRVIGEDIEISAHLDRDLGKVKADPIHIDQVIMNLVVNARDAMGGGGRLTIETANVVLDEQYVGRHIGVKPGPYAMLAISDTGSGMPPEVRNRIFEPFFTTKEAGKGTGLGLSIVYGIVKQNLGEVMVYSEVGKGTTFKIYLPLVEVSEEAATGDLRPSELQGDETILLCEDEPGIRKLVRTMLDKQGYRVLEAATPQDALEIAAAKNDSIDLLLTDVVMPQMTGFDLARNMQDLRPSIKVLYMSGYTDNRISSTWELSPNMAFLHKPFTAVSLAQKVRETLASSSGSSA